MGVYLSSPDTRKTTHSDNNSRFIYASSSMQGWRLNMEDAEVHTLNLKGNESHALFCIFDGHGGAECARYCGKYYEKVLLGNKNYINGKYEQALKESFLEMDVLFRKKENLSEIHSMKNEPNPDESTAGCTANVILIVDNHIYCANAGDSRTILLTDNGSIIPLSIDHKPDNIIEKNRITAAGGFILDGRVNGNLNLSRAIGDLEYKKNTSLRPEQQLISAMPDVKARKIEGGDKFLVMGCDGIWEIPSNEDIRRIVETNKNNLAKGCEEILDKG